MRLAIDTGGTFTDLIVETGRGEFRAYKSPTTPHDPATGILDVLQVAADDMGMSRERFLSHGRLLVHATTRGINAILTGTTGKTAFLTTGGHPDVLLFREAGRSDPFDHRKESPRPYVPRSLTYEVPERIGADGEIVLSLDKAAVLDIIKELRRQKVEAVGVCLLWSIINPVHELQVAELLGQNLPGVPFTLSHQINPTLREYRRASSTCIDASLKPVMADYLRDLTRRLRGAGFGGRILMMSSEGGALDIETATEAPIHTLKSGPAMPPVAGKYYASLDAGADDVIVADAGGTSYDVSLIRSGRITWTRETWLGEPYIGDMTGFPSVDVRSIGAGGGSIAWVDPGGLLHVGPQSAGSDPGPVCYRAGGTQPTVTDASLVLGYLDAEYFLGGRIRLEVEAAREALERVVCAPLGIGVHEAAAAILRIVTENMVTAIEEITIRQGIDPRKTVLIAGGGAAGLNAVGIARRLGCQRVIIPQSAAVLSCAGALLSNLSADYAAVYPASSSHFDVEGVNQTLRDLRGRCEDFVAGPGKGSSDSGVEFLVEAHYPDQVWDLAVPLRTERFSCAAEVEQLRQDFHAAHQRTFATQDVDAPVEMTVWRARVWCRMRDATSPPGIPRRTGATAKSERLVYFADGPGRFLDAKVYRLDALTPETRITGPAIMQSEITTVVIDPDAVATSGSSGSLIVHPFGLREADLVSTKEAVR